MTFAFVGDDTIYTAIDHKPKTTRSLRRLSNIERDPRVTVLVDRYDEDWAKLWWCRLRGTATVAEEGSTDFLKGVEALTAKYEAYQRTRVRGPVIVIAVTDGIGWTALR